MWGGNGLLLILKVMAFAIACLVVASFYKTSYRPVGDRLEISMEYRQDVYADTIWQFYYTIRGSLDQGFTEAKSAKCRANTPEGTWKTLTCSAYLPRHAKVQKLRLDVMEFPGHIRIKNITLSGIRLQDLAGVNDLSLNEQLKILSGDLSGELELQSSGNDPFFSINKDLNLKGQRAYNFTNIACLAIILALSYLIALQVLKAIASLRHNDGSSFSGPVVVHYKTRKFMNIEILRFMLVMFVVLEHAGFALVPLHGTYDVFRNFISPGRSQLFFVIAGFFLFYSPKQLQTPIAAFIKKRWLRMSSLLIFATMIGYVFWHFEFARQPLEGNILNSLLLNWLADSDWDIVGPGWYVNSLFFLSTIYFIIYKVLDKKYALLATVCLAAIASNFYARDIHLGNAFIWGRMPGAAFSLSIGILMAEAYKRLPQDYVSRHIHATEKLVWTLAEIFVFSVLCIGLYGRGLGIWIGNNTMSGCMIALMWLFLIHRGWFSRMLNQPFAIYFGKYTYSIFIMHTFVISYLVEVFIPNNRDFALQNPLLVSFGTIASVLLFSVFCHHFVEIPLSRWTAAKFLNQSTTKMRLL